MSYLLAEIPTALVWFLPSLLAVVAIASASARLEGSFGKVCTAAVVFAMLSSLATALYEASDPINNRLVRDVVAFALVGTSAPGLAAIVAVLSRRASVWFRVLASLLVGTLPLAASPLILILAHCSSGDCL